MRTPLWLAGSAAPSAGLQPQAICQKNRPIGLFRPQSQTMTSNDNRSFKIEPEITSKLSEKRPIYITSNGGFVYLPPPSPI